MRRIHCSLLVLALSSATASGQDAKLTLHVASPELPARFTPTGFLTVVERQALDLIYESLLVADTDAGGNRTYRPNLPEQFPSEGGVRFTFRLRGDARWSNGEGVRPGDIRHTVRLLQQDPSAERCWSEFLDAAIPGDGPRDVILTLKHGTLDPLTWATFPIVPQLVRERELARLDDPEFARVPIGSGPFEVIGIEKGKGRSFLRLRANPHHRDAARLPFREIHWFAAVDAKDLAEIAPDLALGFDSDFWKSSGNDSKLTPVTPSTRGTEIIAINQRQAGLGMLDVRRFLGTALRIDPPANGLVPRDSWASDPRVPERWHQPVVAETLARALAASGKTVRLTFKFPAGNENKRRVDGMIEQWLEIAKKAKLDLQVTPQALPSSGFAEVLRTHDYELALLTEGPGDDVGRLAALLDGRAEALAAGGSNFLGIQDSVTLSLRIDLFGSRQFPRLRDRFRNLHVHLYETMPLIPLRPAMATFAVGSRWRLTLRDPARPFLDLSDWHMAP